MSPGRGLLAAGQRQHQVSGGGPGTRRHPRPQMQERMVRALLLAGRTCMTSVKSWDETRMAVSEFLHSHCWTQGLG